MSRARPPMPDAPTPRRRAPRDFGFDPAQAPHHFAVAHGRDGSATLVERFVWGEEADERAAASATTEPRLKATLDAYRWERVAPAAAEEFNARLRRAGLRAAEWRRGETLLAAHFGKELTLLAWAVEDADPTLLPNMLANWLGLAPEERWWLYTTINATSGHPEHDRQRGWRRAIKIAFAENPTQAPPPSALLSEPPALPVAEEDRLAAALGAPRRRKAAKARATPPGQARLLIEETTEYTPDDRRPTDAGH